MVKSKDNKKYNKDEFRWRIIEIIHDRWVFLENDKITLEYSIDFADMRPSDVHIIVNSLANNEKILKVINPELDAVYTTDKNTIKSIRERAPHIMPIEILDNFSSFYEKEKYQKLSKKKSDPKSAEKFERDNLLNLILGMAIDKYNYIPDGKKSTVPQDIYDALKDNKYIQKPVSAPVISKKLREAAGWADKLDSDNEDN